MTVSATRIYWGLVGLLLAASVFFSVGVELRRARWRGEQLEIPSETVVATLRIVDGDEVVVRHGEQIATVRILGIKCFDAKSNDPTTAGAGQRCMNALRDRVLGERVTIHYDELKFDGNKRLLAYLDRDGTDVGEELVRDGHALVYTRYPFSREADYLADQARARSQARGLWASDKAVVRATALDAAWRAQREDGGG